MGELLVDINDVVLRRLPLGLTHEDVLSAALNILAHHAHCAGIPRAELHGFVDDAYDCHADAAKTGRWG